MAKVTSVNLTPATGSEAMFMLMEWLRDSMLFTITRSGDGLAAFDQTGTTVITNGGSGANGMANTDAHFTAQDPAGVYEWCFQRGGSNTSWETVVSSLDGFTGGSAAVRPTATDEQTIIDTTLLYTDNLYRWHLTGDTAAVGATVGVYPWRAFGTIKSSGNTCTFIAHEPLEPGSYPELVGTRAVPTTGEPDPCVYIASYDTAGHMLKYLGATGYINWIDPSVIKGWFCMNGVNGNTEEFTGMPAATIASGAAANEWHYPGSLPEEGVGVDPRDSSDPFSKVLVGRGSRVGTYTGPKGFLSSLRLPGVDRNYPSTMDIGGERYVHMHHILVPFENGATPL